MAAPRREMDRRSDRGDRDENAYRKQPARPNDAVPPAAAPPPRRPQLNEYWIDGEGINRQVLQMEICKYLGNDATSRPGDYEGRPGFKIRALRPFTPDMLDDLREASKAFSRENKAHQNRSGRGNTSSISPSPVPYNNYGSYSLTPPPDLDYQNSQTYENSSNAPVDYERNHYNGRDSPSYSSGPSGFAPAPAGFPTSSAPYTTSPGYAVPAPGGQLPMDQRYPVGQDYGYAPPPHPSHPSAVRDMRDRDPRDSRDPRDPRNAQYGSSYPNQYPQGTYPNDAYRSGQDPRADPRMNQDAYYSNNNNYGGQYNTNGRDTRMDTGGPYESIPGISGPGGYAPGPGRGAMSPGYDNQGRDYRPPPVNPHYGGGRR